MFKKQKISKKADQTLGEESNGENGKENMSNICFTLTQASQNLVENLRDTWVGTWMLQIQHLEPKTVLRVEIPDIQVACEGLDMDALSGDVYGAQNSQAHMEGGEIDDSNNESAPTDPKKKERGK